MGRRGREDALGGCSAASRMISDRSVDGFHMCTCMYGVLCTVFSTCLYGDIGEGGRYPIRGKRPDVSSQRKLPRLVASSTIVILVYGDGASICLSRSGRNRETRGRIVRWHTPQDVCICWNSLVDKEQNRYQYGAAIAAMEVLEAHN